MVQATLDGGCWEDGKLCVDIDPVAKTDPRRKSYHLLSHPEIGKDA